LHSIQLLSLDALLTVIDTIDVHCVYRASLPSYVPSGSRHESRVAGRSPTWRCRSRPRIISTRRRCKRKCRHCPI
jgi:hypothetical protein